MLVAGAWINHSGAGAARLRPWNPDDRLHIHPGYVDSGFGGNKKPGAMAGSRTRYEFNASISRRRCRDPFGHLDQSQGSRVADSSPLVVRRYLAWAQSQLAQVRNHDPRQSQGFARLVPDMALQGRCCRRSSFSPVSGAGAALNK